MSYREIRLLFATASPRRYALAQEIRFVNPDKDTTRLLHEKGISRVRPVFMPANADEVTLSGAEDTAAANARLKGEWGVRTSGLPTLAFDTVVGLDGAVFGKPKTEEEATDMFRALCGNTHEVITAVFLGYKGKIIEKTEKTYVTFGAFDERLVYNYVKSGAPFDKAGGYNIDDAAIKPLIAGVSGDYNNVVGLPVGLTEKLIEEIIIYGKDEYSC